MARVLTEKRRLLAEYEDDRKQQAVIGWRLDRYLEIGFPIAQACALAQRNDVDHHKAARMVAGGCDTDTAFQILMPFDFDL